MALERIDGIRDEPIILTYPARLIVRESFIPRTKGIEREVVKSRFVSSYSKRNGFFTTSYYTYSQNPMSAGNNFAILLACNQIGIHG